MNQLSTAQLFAVWVLPVLFAITLHEVAHGWVASKFGDKTALMLGRVTLNPIKHIDLVGTIIVPSLLLMLSGFVFGWAKPVPVNWRNLKNPRRDKAIVALAGPVSNLLMALLWACVAKLSVFLVQTQSLEPAIALSYMGQAGILINLVIMVLNLLPIPPLDGSRVVGSFLSPHLESLYNRIEPFGFFILIFLIMTKIMSIILVPPVFFLNDLIKGLFGL